jgi:hypothetical protein
MGKDYITGNKRIREINAKTGITLDDYEFLYKIPELKEIWSKFFQKQILFRALMLSRANRKNRLIFMKFLHRFEEGFKDEVFDHIA